MDLSIQITTGNESLGIIAARLVAAVLSDLGSKVELNKVEKQENEDISKLLPLVKGKEAKINLNIQKYGGCKYDAPSLEKIKEEISELTSSYARYNPGPSYFYKNVDMWTDCDSNLTAITTTTTDEIISNNGNTSD